MTSAIRHTCEGYDFPVYFTVYYLILTQWGIKVIWFVFVITVFPTYRYVSVYGAGTCAFSSAKRQRATGLLEMAISSQFSLLGHQTNMVCIYGLFQNKPQNMKLHLSIQSSQIWFIKIVQRHCKYVSTLSCIFQRINTFRKIISENPVLTKTGGRCRRCGGTRFNEKTNLIRSKRNH